MLRVRTFTLTMLYKQTPPPSPNIHTQFDYNIGAKVNLCAVVARSLFYTISIYIHTYVYMCIYIWFVYLQRKVMYIHKYTYTHIWYYNFVDLERHHTN